MNRVAQRDGGRAEGMRTEVMGRVSTVAHETEGGRIWPSPPHIVKHARGAGDDLRAVWLAVRAGQRAGPLLRLGLAPFFAPPPVLAELGGVIMAFSAADWLRFAAETAAAVHMPVAWLVARFAQDSHALMKGFLVITGRLRS
ncbi:hypothetical protein VY88_21095 [Azospirillum thiophilum]|uniref:Uncharacterized protein n=1 Tax=Azospirillum thiophilum TaxID=528244 RepID=A0AAC8W1F0_9PROT|nr:hypothetical protein AL072_20270 [Azospirillum thiophilum]KJR62781.1 hypothetical protein VY88_21095 [Azospirillum thiophilum]